MNRIYVFLIQNDVWIYILCGLGIFWYGSELFRARRALRRAVFGLERERGKRLQSNALIFLTALVAIAGAVAYVNSQIRPELPQELLAPATPTPNIFRTPLSSPTPLRDIFGTPEVSPTAPLAPTVTLRPGGAAVPVPGTPGTPDAEATEEPVGGETPGSETQVTFTPTPPAVTSGCSPTINISTPPNGSFVFGAVAFLGTANAENFAFYRLEINGPQTSGQWASLPGQTITQPVANGLLGTGNFTSWQNGRYTVRLIVVDNTSNEVGECQVQIDIRNQ